MALRTTELREESARRTRPMSPTVELFATGLLNPTHMLAVAVTTLTAGFSDLVEALDEGAAIVVDAAWAEASGGDEGRADA